MPLLSLSVVDAIQQKLESVPTNSAKNKWMDKLEEREFTKFKNKWTLLNELYKRMLRSP